MSLQPGQVLAHYRIERKIGEGGMGEVWAATDTRLNRSAAIKALPAAVAAEPERLARFKREAQLLAALNHPNIASIYGLEQVGDASYLALELVEGDDLSQRIARGAFSPDEAAEVALQIAAALEEAHDKGIVHRDLKPANIKLDEDARVKVLDFGLAKALSGDADDGTSDVSLSASPTVTAAMGTQVGMILGTAGYMAPEQARGKKVDRRADIWAFGVILFEMLVGERMFTGETVTDVIAQVVTREPDWDKLPAQTPEKVRRVLRRCLRKDPRKRLRDVGDAALELRGEFEDEPVAALTAPPRASFRNAWFLGAAGLVLGATLATVAGIGFSRPGEKAPVTWTNLATPAGAEVNFDRLIELSPDGRRIAFVAVPPGGDEKMLWVRDLDSEVARPLEGTEGAKQPFWSPDSASIGYFAKRRLRTIRANGGPSTALDDVGDDPRGGGWAADGTILFGPDWSQPLYRIPATGGSAQAITALSEDRLELSHRWPHMLPDGKHFLFYSVSTYPALNPENPSEVDKSGLYLGSLEGDEPRLVQTVRSRAVYVDGKLFYVEDNVLTARPFDLASLSFSGEPMTIAENVTQSVGALWGGGLFSISAKGNLLFVRGAQETRAVTRLRWLDRQGGDAGTFGAVQPYNSIHLSADNTRLAAGIGDPSDVWIFDLAHEVSTRFTFDPGDDDAPVWSPRGDRVAFGSSRIIPGQRFAPGNLFVKESSGLQEEEQLPLGEHTPNIAPSAWSPDGTVLMLNEATAKTGADLMLYTFETGELTPWLVTPGDERWGVFSPNGRWVAYESNETGHNEIYVKAFSGGGGKWQISNGGGEMPHWRADGRELFYTTPDDEMMAVPVKTEGAFRNETPVKLFDTPRIAQLGSGDTWAVDAAGQRFLFLAPPEDNAVASATITLVQGWPSLLK